MLLYSTYARRLNMYKKLQPLLSGEGSCMSISAIMNCSRALVYHRGMGQLTTRQDQFTGTSQPMAVPKYTGH